jgi:type VI secretion system protein ImpM
MNPPTAVSLVYFGKIPSRGDFVRSSQQSGLIQTLDRWLTHGLELMSADARWKEIYDRTPPLHFAFLGMKSRVALAGHLVASADGSGRRFPFIAAGSFDVGAPAEFVARSPMVLARPWLRFERAAQQATTAADAGPVLGELSSSQVELDIAPQAYDASFRDFLELQTVGSLEAMLRQAGHPLNLRQMLLALGLLLQPVPTSGSSQLDKGLRLPLPVDPLYQPLVSTLWLELVSRFLRNGDFELAIFVGRGTSEADAAASAPTLSLGFSGGSPSVLQAALDAQVGEQVFVDLRDAQWVEEHVQQDYAVKKLSSYLQQPQLSLKQAHATFREAFLGE